MTHPLPKNPKEAAEWARAITKQDAVRAAIAAEEKAVTASLHGVDLVGMSGNDAYKLSDGHQRSVMYLEALKARLKKLTAKPRPVIKIDGMTDDRAKRWAKEFTTIADVNAAIDEQAAAMNTPTLLGGFDFVRSAAHGKLREALLWWKEQLITASGSGPKRKR